jgi:hypothetical protein
MEKNNKQDGLGLLSAFESILLKGSSPLYVRDRLLN